MIFEDLSPAQTAFLKPIAFDRIGSTSDHAKKLAAEGSPAGTIVWALEQTEGHGRLGRRWSSPPGNLYMSAILRPGVAPMIATELGFVAAIAAADYVQTYISAASSVTLKWPNDVLVDGAKIGGILLEAQSGDSGILDWVVIGIGINLVAHPSDAPYPVTSLQAIGAAVPSAETALARLCERLDHWLTIWRRDGFEPVRDSWLCRAHGLGQAVDIASIGCGIFHDLDHDGALLLRTGDHLRRVTAGDVQFAAV